MDAIEASKDADAAVIVTEWNEFKFLNLDRLKQAMRGNVIFDGRNVYDPDRMRRLGFDYHCIGRGTGSHAVRLPMSQGSAA